MPNTKKKKNVPRQEKFICWQRLTVRQTVMDDPKAIGESETAAE